MPYIRDSFWRGWQFPSLAAMQTAAVSLCVEVAGRRACRPPGGAAPGAVFAAAEAHTLQQLPARPFELATWSTATVGLDIHAKVGKTIYSIPWRFIEQRVDARETPLVVQLFHQGTVIATHGRKPSGKQTDLGDYPPEKIAFRMRTPTWCRTRAAEIGPACTQGIAGLLEANGLFRLRATQGMLGLAGTDRLEAACVAAVTVGDPPYRTSRASWPSARRPARPGPPLATAGPQPTCTALRSCSRTSSHCCSERFRCGLSPALTWYPGRRASSALSRSCMISAPAVRPVRISRTCAR